MITEKIGQINRGSLLGDIIYEMCKQEDIKIIVDIGTWNGMGTTKCICDSIIDNHKECLVYSIEANPYFHSVAITNLPKIANFNLLLGRIIEIEDLINLDEYNDSFFVSSSRDIQKTWMNEDLDNYSKIENLLSLIPKKIDLLILDGGEFSSFSEFQKLKDRTTYFILDDTKTIKNYKVAEIMRDNSDYQIIQDSSDRNGFLISKKYTK